MVAFRMTSNRAPSGGPVTLTVLGSGDAFASGGRCQSAYFIEGAGARVMLEAGPDLVGSLKRHRIAPESLDQIIVSHLHGDHFAGIPFLFLEYMYESPRKHPITIAGPPKLKERAIQLMHAMYAGFDLSKVEKKIKWVVLEPGRKHRLGPLQVSAIRSPHTKPDVSLSLKLAVDGKSIVFTGDTGWNEDLVKLADGADLFLCECTYYESSQFKFHLNYPLLSANRDKFHVKRMVLTHLGREVLNHEADVQTEMAFDGMRIEV
jgi:ribonuclease BN (tRNA processing enzyme)